MYAFSMVAHTLSEESYQCFPQKIIYTNQRLLSRINPCNPLSCFSVQRKMLRFDNYNPEPPTPAESVEIRDYNDKEFSDDLAIRTESSVATDVPGYDEEVNIRRYREDSVSTVFDSDMGDGERSVSQPEGVEGIRIPPNLQVKNRAIAAHV